MNIIRAVIFIMTFNVLADDVMEFRIQNQTQEEIASRIVVLNGQYEIYASGVIEDDSDEKFERFILQNKIDNAVVIFNSIGGSLVGGIKLGQKIRNLNFNTAIGIQSENKHNNLPGLCASSCAYAFAGGRYRYLGEGSKLGIHQYYKKTYSATDFGDSQIISSLVLGYLESMGVDSKAFQLASLTPNDQMTWLSQDQALKLRLSNNGKDAPTVEIKLVNSLAYLKVDQFSSDVGARLLLSCVDGMFMIGAGIVTNDAVAKDKFKYIKKSYLDLSPGGVFLDSPVSDSSISKVGNVIWIKRKIDRKTLLQVIHANSIGFWTESDSVWRWGAILEIYQVKDKINEFIKGSTMCL